VLALTTALQALAIAKNGIPALIGTDQEGGLVQRLNSAGGFMVMPDAKTVGASLCPEAMRRYGRAVGEEMKAVGVNLAFAPVLDVNDNPENPVIGSLGRSFGISPSNVEETAVPFMLGLHDAGVIATGKHFPGHGSTTEDSHNALPFVTKDRAALEAVELPPFQTAIEQGIDLIMPAHVTYEALDPSGLPATVSRPIQTDLLRGELGFRGVIVTDDLGMEGIVALFPSGEAAVRAIEAGADMVLCVRMELSGACAPETIDEIHAALHKAVRSGRLSLERIDESFDRILALKAKYRVGPVTSDGLPSIQGAEHFRALAGVLEAVANRREEEGRP
jgi:beta-N-acetylhexosaminidase